MPTEITSQVLSTRSRAWATRLKSRLRYKITSNVLLTARLRSVATSLVQPRGTGGASPLLISLSWGVTPASFPVGPRSAARLRVELRHRFRPGTAYTKRRTVETAQPSRLRRTPSTQAPGPLESRQPEETRFPRPQNHTCPNDWRDTVPVP